MNKQAKISLRIETLIRLHFHLDGRIAFLPDDLVSNNYSFAQVSLALYQLQTQGKVQLETQPQLRAIITSTWEVELLAELAVLKVKDAPPVRKEIG